MHVRVFLFGWKPGKTLVIKKGLTIVRLSLFSRLRGERFFSVAPV